VKRGALFGILLAVLSVVAACQHVHEPWTLNDNQLKQERTRTDAAKLELRHRFLWVQTDR
jgi:hypothetical protein